MARLRLLKNEDIFEDQVISKLKRVIGLSRKLAAEASKEALHQYRQPFLAVGPLKKIREYHTKLMDETFSVKVNMLFLVSTKIHMIQWHMPMLGFNQIIEKLMQLVVGLSEAHTRTTEKEARLEHK
ncbi:hypothetical protein V6N13_123649 [Hibiscus sabdariffa]|uniref:Uncharacterized protein n=1 Tax=Hibiscus sabdariffa TaxID=183260 RepID=A0ABR2QTY8_9ROSI